MKIVYLFLICLPALLSAQPILMFPGDTNNDGTADHYDLLPVGIANGVEGFPRPAATPDWIPQLLAEPWDISLPVSQINVGFVDTDGNGFIDSVDIDAIALNYDSIQNSSDPPPSPYFPLLIDTCFSCPKPDLVITFDRDTAMINDTFFAILNLVFPPDIDPEMGALGIAFDLTYDPENVVDSLTAVFADTLPGDLMFVTATSTLARPWRNIPPGNVGFGAAGKGMNALFEPRELGRLRIIVDEAIIRSGAVAADFWVDASNLLLLNRMEQVICPGHIAVDTIVLFDPVSGVEEGREWQEELLVFPNPAGEWIQVQSPATPVTRLALLSATGQEVLRWQGRDHFPDLSLTGLDNGLYYLLIQTGQGISCRLVMHRK